VIVRIYGDFGDFWRFWAAKNKANQSQSYLAHRFIWGLKTRVEKTKPIKPNQSQFWGSAWYQDWQGESDFSLTCGGGLLD